MIGSKPDSDLLDGKWGETTAPVVVRGAAERKNSYTPSDAQPCKSASTSHISPMYTPAFTSRA